MNEWVTILSEWQALLPNPEISLLAEAPAYFLPLPLPFFPSTGAASVLLSFWRFSSAGGGRGRQTEREKESRRGKEDKEVEREKGNRDAQV